MDEYGNRAAEGTIQVSDAYLTLHQLEKDPVSWPLRYLRRYGFEEGVFIFESGRHGPTGQGIFAFRCSRAEQLFNLVQAHVRNPNLASVTESNNVINQARRSNDTNPVQPSPEAGPPVELPMRNSPEAPTAESLGQNSHMYMNINCASPKNDPVVSQQFPEGQLDAPVPIAPPPRLPEDQGNVGDQREYQNILPCPEQPQLPPKPTPQTPNQPLTPGVDGAFFNGSTDDPPHSPGEELPVYAELKLENTSSHGQQDQNPGMAHSPKDTRYATIDLHKTQALNTTAKLQSQRSMEAFSIATNPGAASSSSNSNGVKEVVKRLKLSQSIVSNSQL